MSGRRERCDITKPALGAHPVRGKGGAHPPEPSEGSEPSFSLNDADARHAVKGDSYVRRFTPAASSRRGAIQKAREGFPTSHAVARSRRRPRLGCALASNPRPPEPPRDVPA